ncbi:hypothetical protein Agabi119p4_7013 [Agaricus bisporus var. burnettii]|uniref:Uncharacterized protein n=1 Tax=Agaricus bisporus var. burnettii TaxID=192524 RepID=A0A8H7F0L6_AGABI|nr:hypothetical protein Agabi119p4_7013 [Agaricus bisporus var. burnettii]
MQLMWDSKRLGLWITLKHNTGERSNALRPVSISKLPHKVVVKIFDSEDDILPLSRENCSSTASPPTRTTFSTSLNFPAVHARTMLVNSDVVGFHQLTRKSSSKLEISGMNWGRFYEYDSNHPYLEGFPHSSNMGPCLGFCAVLNRNVALPHLVGVRHNIQRSDSGPRRIDPNRSIPFESSASKEVASINITYPGQVD